MLVGVSNARVRSAVASWYQFIVLLTHTRKQANIPPNLRLKTRVSALEIQSKQTCKSETSVCSF